MGKVYSLIIRPLRNFNLESRAHNVISKEKPVPAPKHKSDQIDYERIVKEYPEVIQESFKKHEDLDKHLKDIYVKSYDPQIITKSELNKKVNERPLPLNRSIVEDFEFGFKEPEKSPLGKTILKKVMKFISEHQTDPKMYTATKIAEDYLLPEEKVKNILKYFHVYKVYIPEKREIKAVFAAPSRPKVIVTRVPHKQLPAGKKTNET